MSSLSAFEQNFKLEMDKLESLFDPNLSQLSLESNPKSRPTNGLVGQKYSEKFLLKQSFSKSDINFNHKLSRNIILSESRCSFNSVDSSLSRFRNTINLNAPSLSTYEIQSAQMELVQLQMKLNKILHRNEEYDNCLLTLKSNNAELSSNCDLLLLENQSLQKRLAELDLIMHENELQAQQNEDNFLLLPQKAKTELDLINVQQKIVDTDIKLSEVLKSYGDTSISKDAVLRELERERALRIRADKEKDAYCAAYEASLHHFKRWFGSADEIEN